MKLAIISVVLFVVIAALSLFEHHRDKTIEHNGENGQLFFQSMWCIGREGKVCRVPVGETFPLEISRLKRVNEFLVPNSGMFGGFDLALVESRSKGIGGEIVKALLENESLAKIDVIAEKRLLKISGLRNGETHVRVQLQTPEGLYEDSMRLVVVERQFSNPRIRCHGNSFDVGPFLLSEQFQGPVYWWGRVDLLFSFDVKSQEGSAFSSGACPSGQVSIQNEDGARIPLRCHAAGKSPEYLIPGMKDGVLLESQLIEAPIHIRKASPPLRYETEFSLGETLRFQAEEQPALQTGQDLLLSFRPIFEEPNVCFGNAAKWKTDVELINPSICEYHRGKSLLLLKESGTCKMKFRYSDFDWETELEVSDLQ